MTSCLVLRLERFRNGMRHRSIIGNGVNRNLVQSSYDILIHSRCIRTSSRHFDNVLWTRIKHVFNEKIFMVSQMISKQCNFYVSLRLRRMAQIGWLYNRIYSESTINKMMETWVNTFKYRANLLYKKNPRSLQILLSAAGFFCWEKGRITDEELEESVREFAQINISGHNRQSWQNSDISSRSLSVLAANANEERALIDEGWQPIVIRDNLQVWRKSVPNTSLYQYKGKASAWLCSYLVPDYSLSNHSDNILFLFFFLQFLEHFTMLLLKLFFVYKWILNIERNGTN